MNCDKIITVDLSTKPTEHATKFNLIMLENSRVSADTLIKLFESFYEQSPKSFTFIFDFSKDVNRVIDFKEVLEYVDSAGYPKWSNYIHNPIYVGNLDCLPCTTRRAEFCNNIAIQLLGGYLVGRYQLENVWYDVK